MYHACSQSRSWGIMVGMALDVPWVLMDKVLDKEGRYVIIKGRLGSQKLIIAGTDVPNHQQTPFGEEVFDLLVQDGQSKIAMLGDFNAMLNNAMDRSQKSETPELPAKF